ncbi:MAG: hypothetical protein J5795_02465 [Lachnospiraceae bacterium]|nr:hypothetical protein [Lachnospiraceae bacterium]
MKKQSFTVEIAKAGKKPLKTPIQQQKLKGKAMVSSGENQESKENNRKPK